MQTLDWRKSDFGIVDLALRRRLGACSKIIDRRNDVSALSEHHHRLFTCDLERRCVVRPVQTEVERQRRFDVPCIVQIQAVIVITHIVVGWRPQRIRLKLRVARSQNVR